MCVFVSVLVDPFRYRLVWLLHCSLFLSLSLEGFLIFLFAARLFLFFLPITQKDQLFFFSKTTVATGEHDDDGANAGNAAVAAADGGNATTGLTPLDDAGQIGRAHV